MAIIFPLPTIARPQDTLADKDIRQRQGRQWLELCNNFACVLASYMKESRILNLTHIEYIWIRNKS